MAKEFESLKQQALVIKNEVEDGANNTERVGGILEVSAFFSLLSFANH